VNELDAVPAVDSLSVVMPVYNEAAGVADVMADIRRHILDVVPGSDLVVVDDHSTDDTATVLEGIARTDARIRVLVNDVNVGHGRTTRRAMDASTGQWIFHLDSDGQVDVSEFGLLWEQRSNHDLVLGMRVHRHDPLHRLVLTRLTRAVVSLLARRWVRDGNVPFKLIRRSLYDHLRAAIPETAFAPSIMIVIGAHRSHARVAEIETTHLRRTHGRSTLRLKRLAVAVGRSLVETLDFSRRRLPAYQIPLDEQT
jgi:glycosyltransferase involved in cell wall biosynthesis